jgi:hypothetical protein
MDNQMNHETLVGAALIWFVLFLSSVMFIGTPDLHDAILFRLADIPLPVAK